MRGLILVSVVFSLMFFIHCEKDNNNDFIYCQECPFESWLGLYEGSGTYFISNSGETLEGVNVQVTITNPYTENLEIEVKAENYIEDKFLVVKDDTQHYITINSGARSLLLNLYINGDQFKLNGTLKRNRFNNGQQTWDVEKSLTFSVFKLNP
jgi:hypothetical protein